MAKNVVANHDTYLHLYVNF